MRGSVRYRERERTDNHGCLQRGISVPDGGGKQSYDNIGAARKVCLVLTGEGYRICRPEGEPAPNAKVAKADIDELFTGGPDPRGIKNSGSDCFINAALQLFAHSPLLEHVADAGNLSLSDETLDTKDPAEKELEKKRRQNFQAKLREFAEEYYLNGGSCQSPKGAGLRDRLSELKTSQPDFLKQGHQDTTEVFNLMFKCFALDGFVSTFSVYKEPNLSEEGERLHDSLDLTQYTQIDPVSQRVLSEEDPTFVTALPIPKKKGSELVTFQDCLDEFYKEPETDECKYVREGAVRSSQARTVREDKSFGEKGVFFAYQRFIPEKVKSADGSGSVILKKNLKQVSLESFSINLGKEKKRYDLEGFICHLGEGLGNGHYVAYCLCSDNKWYLFNDAHAPQEVSQKTASNEVKNAYVLYFSRADEGSETSQTSGEGE